MDNALIALGFTTGLFTSLHCVGMCGPLVLAVGLSGEGQATFGGTLLRSVLWHAGRGVGLLGIGIALGALGQSLQLGRGPAILAVVAGALTVLVALALPGWLPLPKRLRDGAGAFGQRFMGRLAGRRGLWSALLVGLGTVLLPCGPLYGIWAQAAALGTWGAALLVGAFWAGTVPLLLALGVGGGVAWPRLRRFALPVATALLLASGAVLIFRGVKFLMRYQPPCCH
jgi:hypothetical protein